GRCSGRRDLGEWLNPALFNLGNVLTEMFLVKHLHRIINRFENRTPSDLRIINNHFNRRVTTTADTHIVRVAAPISQPISIANLSAELIAAIWHLETAPQ